MSEKYPLNYEMITSSVEGYGKIGLQFITDDEIKGLEKRGFTVNRVNPEDKNSKCWIRRKTNDSDGV